MCGRISQGFTWEELAERLDLIGAPVNLEARFNVAPGQYVQTVRLEEGDRQLVQLLWGLIPSWAKEQKIAWKLINARAETAHSKPSFRGAYKARRCLVPVDGFYEWTDGKSGRQPWRIVHRDGAVLALAGLWESWRIPENAKLTGALKERQAGDGVETFTIITTEANDFMKQLHGRMPAILVGENCQKWLEGGETELAPLAEDCLRFYKVTSSVNSPRFEGPVCAEPLNASGGG